jgi:hypothetical protein
MTTSVDRRCEQCGEPLPLLSRSDRRYCTTACRAAASRRRDREAEARVFRGSLGSSRANAEAGFDAALARGLDEQRLIAIIATEARRSWRAAAWLAERVYPERWGPARLRPDEQPPPMPVLDDDDPFREVDELAERRRLAAQPQRG